ncbi:hypothetical protein PHAVU_005G152200 [Phaseolus vulgaris]|uniref:Uncharacterized protein n=2 Tax=Phaseolus vulgaris TaxID=3885 RepID=V7BZC9_PHAVU|nr:hypothetical protein PHAVU_005G152200g [Phaseolus vulgaris]ESW22415.1 hypothetical protein PHAVU_005G152200g [Phaseolus vulgaris]
MSLPANGTGFCMGTVHKMTSHLCKLRNQVDDICLQVSSDSNTKGPSLSVEDKSYPANAFLPSVNVLAFLLFLVASSYFLLRKSVDTFGSCREKHAQKVSSSDSTVSNASMKNDATAAYDNLSISESSGCSHRISYMNSYKCDAYFEISDLDKACYMNSLLSLEDDDDSEWLSDLMPCGSSSEEPSTPLSYKSDAYYEISDFEQGCYIHSLLNLDDEDSEWLSDSKSFERSSEEPSTPLSYKSDSYYAILDFDKESYLHSLLSLEDEESEWLSDSKSFGCSSDNPSTPFSYKFDVASEISDLDKAVYMRSLLNFEDEDSECLSDSKSYECSSENPSTPFSCKIDLASEISDLDKARYLPSLFSFEDDDSEWLPESKSYACSSENLSTPLRHKSNAFSEISDLDKESYTHSLINLEDEDSEWFSNSKSFEYSFENPSTPLRYEGQISHLDKAGYFHSLLSLEDDDDDDDSEWLSDSKPYACSPENLSTPLSYKTDAFSEISDLDKASYMHSLLNLEGEESEWLSDSKSFGCSSSENPSTPFSYKFDDVSDISDLDKEYCMHSLLILEDENSDRLLDCKSYYECSSENSTPLSSKCDSYYNVSDLDKASYLHSLLILEDEHSEWLSDSTSWDIVVPPSVSTCSNFGDSEDKNLLETAGLEENFSADEPLFWPLEGKVNWNSEETWSSFCTSPRRRFALNSGVCSVNKKEYFALGEEVPIETLMGLKEFDGHEGLLLDSEFNDVFVVDE